MFPNELLGAGMLVGLLAAFWSRLKAIVWRVANLLIAQVDVDGVAESAVRGYLWQLGKPSKYGEKVYTGEMYFVRPAGRRLAVAAETVGTAALTFWVGWKPLLVHYKVQAAGNHVTAQRISVLYVRWMFDGEQLVRDAVKWFNETTHGPLRGNRYQVYRVVGQGQILQTAGAKSSGDIFAKSDDESGTPLSVRGDPASTNRYLDWTKEELGEPLPTNPFEFLAYPPEGRAVQAEVAWWLANEKEYRSRGVPWRMGIALTGPPGTGKTSLARAVAQEQGLPIYAIELATMTDRELIRAWRRAKDNAPAVVLIEDVDTVFVGREVVAGGPVGLSFGTLLNCLSGAEGADGILTFVTTNQPQTLDPALGAPDPETGRSTRPGRIDKVVHLGPLDLAGRELVASKILAGFPEDAARIVAAGDGATGAVFQQMAVERAFELIRAGRDNPS